MGFKRLLLGGIPAAVAAIILSSTSCSESKPESDPPSDEEQIRTVIAEFESAWNDSDFAALVEITCEKNQPDAYRPGGGTMTADDFQQARVEEGRVEITVKHVWLDGDKAIAAVDEKSELEVDNDEMKFVREGGQWRGCAD